MVSLLYMEFHRHVTQHHTFMYLWIVGSVLVLGALGLSYFQSHPEGVLDGQHEGDVRTLVGAFGNQLGTVSLLSPEAGHEIRQAYGPYASPELVDAWAADPGTAPGRLTSSPWPDHIDIGSVTAVTPTVYAVEGAIAMITSGGDAGSVPVSLTVEMVGNRYLITAYREDRGTSAQALPSSGTAETLTAGIGESVTAFGVTVTPAEILEDSRCPADVQCVQAGTVRVKGTLADGMGTSEMTFKLGEQVSGETAYVTLASVTPEKQQSPSDPASYRLTFRIEYR